MAKVTIVASAETMIALLATLTGRNDVQIESFDSNGNGQAEPAVQESAPNVQRTQTRQPSNRAPRASVRYHVTRKGKGNLDKIVGLTPKARVVREYLLKKGPRSLSELQRELGTGRTPMNPKTVDGSVYALRHMGVIESKTVE